MSKMLRIVAMGNFQAREKRRARKFPPERLALLTCGPKKKKEKKKLTFEYKPLFCLRCSRPDLYLEHWQAAHDEMVRYNP